MLPCAVYRHSYLRFFNVTIQNMKVIINRFSISYLDVEVRTPCGRVDMVLRTKTTLYVMELKLDKSANEAMDQID